jgi:hypothetical protein
VSGAYIRRHHCGLGSRGSIVRGYICIASMAFFREFAMRSEAYACLLRLDRGIGNGNISFSSFKEGLCMRVCLCVFLCICVRHT